MNVVLLALPALLTAAAARAQCIPTWQPPAHGKPLNNSVFAVAGWDPDGMGPLQPVVVAGGNFQASGGAPSDGVAMWNANNGWQPMTAGVVGGNVRAATQYDTDGLGPSLPVPVIAGAFVSVGGVPANRVASWNGATWQPLGAGIGVGFQTVHSLMVYDGDLIACGQFNVAGGAPAASLARWDGSAWHSYPGPTGGASALAAYQGDLVIGGFMSNGSANWGVLRWDEGKWSTMGQNYPIGPVWALATFRGDLVAGGSFQEQHGEPGNRIARFDGATWLPLGSGLDGQVRALSSWDPDGTGPMEDLLIVGGSFSTAGGVPVFGIAAWDGQQWSALGTSLNGSAEAFTAWNGDLIVGGSFGTAGGIPSPYFARYGCGGGPCEPDCNGDGLLNLADFGCFQTTFANGNLQADCNRDSALNLADFGCFMTMFALGCP